VSTDTPDTPVPASQAPEAESLRTFSFKRRARPPLPHPLYENPGSAIRKNISDSRLRLACSHDDWRVTSHYIWSKVGGTADVLPWKKLKKYELKQNLTGILERSPDVATFCWRNTYFWVVIHNDFSKKWGDKIVQQVIWPRWPPMIAATGYVGLLHNFISQMTYSNWRKKRQHVNDQGHGASQVACTRLYGLTVGRILTLWKCCPLWLS